jgi:hypothetical protein
MRKRPPSGRPFAFHKTWRSTCIALDFLAASSFSGDTYSFGLLGATLKWADEPSRTPGRHPKIPERYEAAVSSCPLARIAPWYPIPRLFRQTKKRDYREIVDRVRKRSACADPAK